MNISFRNAKEDDVKTLVMIYDKAFYDDFVKYGKCPAYGKSEEMMLDSLRRLPKEIIICDDCSVGVISVEDKGNGEYYVGCLCVIPEYQGKGIGTMAIKHMIETRSDWKSFSLVTPADKKENIKFYCEKCGFEPGERQDDDGVEVVSFYLNRN
ncbi:MAG: GNAT family N-acetyltransferase [Ruminococcus sp.]|nr:GNAT family N-acetyltransferase [Ruminococcus sp.]